MGLFSRMKVEMPAPEDALPGRAQEMPVTAPHFVLGTPITPPFPEGTELALFGMGCFWGAERMFWQLGDGIYTTAVGYSAGYTPNPTYEEVCSARTGHNEVVRVVFDPAGHLLRAAARDVLGGPRPDAGHAPGQRRRHAVPLRRSTRTRTRSGEAAEATRDAFGERLTAAGYGPITTEIEPAGDFYYAEDYHQQYLAKVPNGYCGLGGTGVTCPVGLVTD